MENNITHFVYPYVYSSAGWELLLSLRSLMKHVKGEFDITIIGDIPTWVNQEMVNCIEFNNSRDNVHRQSLINEKIIKASEIFEEFVIMNDDIIIMKDIEISEIYPLKLEVYSEELEKQMSNIKAPSSFIGALSNSSVVLKNVNKRSNVNFVTHCPHRYSSKVIREISKEVNLAPESNTSVIFENIYFNYINIEAPYVGTKRFGVWSYKNILEYNGETYFNFNEKGEQESWWIRSFLFEKFKEPCEVEK